MKLIVYPEVVAGLDRGGEDLSLVFELSSNEVPNLDAIEEVEMESADGDGYSVEVNGDQYTYESDHYDFTWSGTKEDALKLLREADPEWWELCGKPGKPKVRLVKFIDGNAD